MKESIKKKFDSIDKSKIKVESTKELLAKIEKALNSKTQENVDKAEALLDKFISQAKAKKADIFVSKKAEPTLTPTEKKKATQVVKSKLETLMDTIASDPLLKDFNNARRSKGGGKSDPLIDSERKAIQSGVRVSKKGWKNQYGKSQGGRKYYEYRENRIDRKAPNYGDRPWLKEGGFIHPSDANADKYVVVEIKEDGSRREHNNFGDLETARMFASLKREFLPKGSQLMIEDKDGKKLYRSFKSGGQVDESTAMVLSQNKAIAHHTEELKKALAKNPDVEPWVVGKIERASTDISDVTHYLDGKTEYAKGGYMADGGLVEEIKMFDKYNYPTQKTKGDKVRAIFEHFKKKGYSTEEINTALGKMNYAKGGYMAKGGDISTWDIAVYKYLEGKSILIYSMGVKTPSNVKITSVIPPDPKFSIPTLVLETGNTEERIDGKEKIENFMGGKEVELYDGKEHYTIELAPMAKRKKTTGDYVKRNEISRIYIKNPNKNGANKYLKINKADFLDGLHEYAKGGKLSDDYTYIKRSDVMEVLYKDGSESKENSNPKNGFWVSKKALVEAGMNETKAEPKKSSLDFGTTSLRKTSSGWIAKNKVSNYKGYDWEITTMKSMRGDLVSTAVGGKNEKSESGYTMFTYVMYQDPNIRLITSKPARITEKVISEQQEKALQEFESKVNEKYAKGGDIGFEGLAKKVAKNYVGDKVKPKYQKEYGKTYDKDEAKEVGKKVAAKVYRQQLAKMAEGGKLPEDLGKYFTKPRGTKVIPMSNIIPIRARAEGIVNAEKYMKMAYEGKMDKRKPITIYKSQGKYRVYDGNSTFAVAKANGWEYIWAQIIKNPNMNTHEMRGKDIFTRAKEIRKEGEAWKDALQRAKAMK